MSNRIKRTIYVLVCLISWGSIFSFFFMSKGAPTPMLKEINNAGDLSKIHSRSIDVTDIIERYLPLGSSYNETIELLQQNGIKSVVPVRRDELLNPKRVSGNEYMGYFSFSSRLTTSDRYLQIYLHFSEEDELIDYKATYQQRGI